MRLPSSRRGRRPAATAVEYALAYPLTFLLILGLTIVAQGIARYQEVAAPARPGHATPRRTATSTAGTPAWPPALRAPRPAPPAACSGTRPTRPRRPAATPVGPATPTPWSSSGHS